MTLSLSTLSAELAALEKEAIFILSKAVAQAQRPLLMLSGGKDSTVLAHLAARAFYPAPPPRPLLHVDSTGQFREACLPRRLRTQPRLCASRERQ